MSNFFKASRETIPRVWLKFTTKNKNGEILKLRAEELTSDRMEEFLDFKMKHYVPNELHLRVTGLHNNKEAMKEYRYHMRDLFSQPSHKSIICCTDNDENKNSEIIAISMMCLKTIDDWKDELLSFKPKTKEMEILIKSSYELENIYPLETFMKNYGIDRVFDDRGGAVHTDYVKLGIGTACAALRRKMCKEFGVPMTVSWMTSNGSRKAVERDGWETLLEISCKDMEKRLGLIFDEAPDTFAFMIGRI